MPVARSPKTTSVRRSATFLASSLACAVVMVWPSMRPRSVVEMTPGVPTSLAYMVDVWEKSVALAVKCST